MPTPLQITVMQGGPSAEREVSLRSGEAVARALRGLGHNVVQIDPRPNALGLPERTDVVFLALHGTFGEDGTIQEELEARNVAYTGCDSASSRIAFDKVLTKQRCREAGVPTAEFRVLRDRSEPIPSGWPLPCVFKPVRQGSSVGLRFVETADQWSEALGFSLGFGSEVLAEPKIRGRETTVGILADAALPIVEVRPRAGSYDYRNKYTPGATEYFCPADFPAAITQRVQRVALAAFEAVGGRDYGRIDIMVTEAGEPVVLEVNTLPGMTETSLLPKGAAAAGLDYAALCQRMVDLALARSGKGG